MQLNLSLFSSGRIPIPTRRPPVTTGRPFLVKRRLTAWAACCSSTTSGDTPSQPGHPQPHSQHQKRQPWNKGLPMPDSTKRKLSQAAKKRWAEHPELRTTTTTLSAKSLPTNQKKPWNAGGNLSEEHKQKISDAMKGRQHSKGSKSLMRASALSRSPASEEAKTNVSKALKGKPKSEQHRAAIAATMRKRHAATRALRAVEAVYLAAATSSMDRYIDDDANEENKGKDDDGVPSLDNSSSSNGDGAGPGPTGKQGLNSITNINSITSNSLSSYTSSPSSSSSFNLPSKNKVLAAFKAELREFRLLQKELTPWTENFVMAHSRKPGMVDVQRTGITWLIEKYKRYILLREHIRLSTQQGLKAKLAAAASSGSSSSSSSSSSYINNADVYGSGGSTVDHPFSSSNQHGGGGGGGNGGIDGARAVAFAKMLAAKNYQEARARKASSSSSMTTTDGDDDDDISNANSESDDSHTTAGLDSTSTYDPTIGISGDFTQQQQGEAEAVDSDLASIGLNMARTTNVDPRVREAVRKAQAYRTAKVQASVKKAEAAAVLAGNGWHDPSLSKSSSCGSKGKKVVVVHGGSKGKKGIPMKPPSIEVLQAQAAAHSAEAEAAKAKVELESEYDKVANSTGISSSDDDDEL